MSDAVAASPPLSEKYGKQTPVKAALVAFLGSMVEYYDFFIYGSAAALIFPRVFFPEVDGVTATLASLSTFAVAYVARPIGSFFIGHFGDRIGRRKVLLFTLILMGVSTFLVGCLPGYDQIGYWAPAVLVLLRVFQGLSAAGEQAGASSMTLEHSPEGRRAFFTSFTLSGTQAGLIVATLVFIPVSGMPDEMLYSWGWRLPFWGSFIVVAFAYWARRHIEEPPTFEKIKAQNEIVRMPLIPFVRYYWSSFIRIILLHFFGVISTAMTVFGLSYATGEQWNIPRQHMLWTIVAANLVAIGAIPLWAKLADRVGRRPVFAFGAFTGALAVPVYFYAITTQNIWLIAGASILMSGVLYSAPNATWPSLYGEMFDARVRYTGLAVSHQFANLAQGFFPPIAAALVGVGTFGWVPVAAVLCSLVVIAGITVFTTRETAFVRLEDLGSPKRTTALAAEATAKELKKATASV